MTQKQQIQLLNSIMPEIVESKDPEATMLKCARKNNLSPAQLEKLGHVFNSMKTLVGLEKQANRGDSFSIVDVPKMVNKYATYDPSRVLNANEEKVHAKVDKLTKGASNDPDGWGACLKFMSMSKSASADNSWCFESKDTLPSCTEWLNAAANDHYKGGKVEFTDVEKSDAWMEVTPENMPSDIMHKAANARLKAYNSVYKDMDEAKDLLQQTVEDSHVVMLEKLAEFKAAIILERSKWEESVKDAKDILDMQKFAKAMEVVENYFEKNRVHGFEKAANIDRGFARRIARDTTGLVDTLEEIADLALIKEKAASMLEGFKQEKSASILGDYDSLLKNVKNTQQLSNLGTQHSSSLLQKDFDKGLQSGLENVTLQTLLLNDPIISEADPATVQDLYATIADLSPTIAKDPIRMAPILKEALQYDALPMQQIKDLLSVEESANKIKKLKAESSAPKNK